MKKLIYLLLITLLISFYANSFLPQAIADQASADTLFAARLPAPDETLVPLAQYKGTPLVVNFWARWCPPCVREIPELNAFRKKYQGRIEVLGIGLEDEAAPVREFMKKHRMDYPVFLAREQGMPLMKALGNRRGGLPYTVFIDRNGQIQSVKMGLLHKADLEAAATQLLK